MKIKYLLPMLLIVAGTTLAATPPQAYCTDFSGSVCYSLENGDTNTRKLIIDFSIDEIQFHDVAHVTIYQGIGLSEQENVGTISKAKSYDAPSGNVTVFLGSRTPDQYFDIHFKPKQGWGVVQIFGYLKDKTAAAAIAKFISTVHPCTRDSLSVKCANNAPFAGAAAPLTNLFK